MMSGLSVGLRYMIAAAFFFSLMSLQVKLVGQRLHSSEIVFFRALLSLLFTYVLLRRAGVPVWGHRKGLLVLRGTFGFIALSCFFFALTRLPLADVTVLHFTNPVFTAVIAAIGDGRRPNESNQRPVAQPRPSAMPICRPNTRLTRSATVNPA